MTDPHACVGLTCWICGEPTELRHLRTLMWEAFNEEKVANDSYRLSVIAANAIREDVIDMLTQLVQLRAEVHLLKQPPITRVEIDPNVRVRGNQTFSGLDDVYGPITVGQAVQVFESEADIVGDAWVADIDNDKGLVYLRVVWSSLRSREK